MERLYTVASVEGAMAHLVDDDGHATSVSVHMLPRGAVEGIVVRVSVSVDGTHDWAASTADAKETTRRRSSQYLFRDQAVEDEMGVDDVT